MSDNKTGLELLREPFPPNQIGLLPKGSKAQMTCPPAEKRNCDICGGWHHPKLVHLSFVGHAALTDRLLDADPLWYWEPLAISPEGLPVFDSNGGLWIKLTVCGMTRIGYGNAEPSQYKEVGSREKEVIGDALRNAAMRFGAALELWHKGDLHVQDDEPPADKPKTEQVKSTPSFTVEVACKSIESLKDVSKARVWLKENEAKMTGWPVDDVNYVVGLWEDKGKKLAGK